MNIADLISKLDNIKNGTYTRLTYKNTVDLPAKLRNAGYYAEKIVSKNVRVGINYKNFIKKSSSSNSTNKKNNFTYIIPNKITMHSNGNTYLDIYPQDSAIGNKVNYLIYKNGHYIGNDIDRYITKTSKHTTGFQRINIDHIINIG